MSGLDSLVIDINPNDMGKSNNFGSGIELLMNDKKKNNSNSIDIDLGNLSNLENELNTLTDDISTNTGSLNSKPVENINKMDSFNVKFDNNIKNVDSNLGEKTSNAFNKNKTWDGYGKYSEVPVTLSEEATMTNEELLKEKLHEFFPELPHVSWKKIQSSCKRWKKRHECFLKDYFEMKQKQALVPTTKDERED